MPDIVIGISFSIRGAAGLGMLGVRYLAPPRSHQADVYLSFFQVDGSQYVWLLWSEIGIFRSMIVLLVLYLSVRAGNHRISHISGNYVYSRCLFWRGVLPRQRLTKNSKRQSIIVRDSIPQETRWMWLRGPIRSRIHCLLCSVLHVASVRSNYLKERRSIMR